MTRIDTGNESIAGVLVIAKTDAAHEGLARQFADHSIERAYLAVVGGLGLMGTMSINVLERTREIGVMRTIGAVDRAIRQTVIIEGLVIGLVTWFYE